MLHRNIPQVGEALPCYTIALRGSKQGDNPDRVRTPRPPRAPEPPVLHYSISRVGETLPCYTIALRGSEGVCDTLAWVYIGQRKGPKARNRATFVGKGLYPPPRG